MSFNEMERGQFDRAEKHLRLGLDAYNSERRAELQDFRTFFTLNKSIFDDIDDKYKTIFTDIVELKEAEIETIDKRMNDNYDILVKNPEFVPPDNWELMETAELMKLITASPGWAKKLTEFSPFQKMQLEAAGLLDSDRDVQLAHLFPPDEKITRASVTDLQRNLDNIATQLNIPKGDLKIDTIDDQLKPYLVQVEDIYSAEGLKWEALKVTEEDVKSMRATTPVPTPISPLVPVPFISVEEEFEEDFRAGMPFEDALTMYGSSLGTDFINSKYRDRVGQFTPIPKTIEEEVTRVSVEAEENPVVGVEVGTEEYFENINKKIQDFLSKPIKFPNIS